MMIPDYQNGSIVNLMSSIRLGCGSGNTPYPPLAGLPPTEVGAARNVVLMVLDGLGYDYLCHHGRESVLAAALRQSIHAVAPPTTAASVTAFLTGLPPQQHGLTGWFTWFRELGSVVTVLPFSTRSGRGNLAENGVSPAELFNHQPFFNQLNRQCYSLMPHWLADSSFNQSLLGQAKLVLHNGLTDFYGQINKQIREHDQPKYLYAYWPGYDSLAHEHGIASKQIQQHFAMLDEGFAQLQQQLAGTDTLLLVTADHGFVDTTPETRLRINDMPQLLDCLQLPLCGEPRLAYCYIRHGKEQHFKEGVAEALAGKASLYPSEQLLEKGLFGLGTPHPELACRIGDYTLVMEQNHILTQTLPGERPLNMIGQHGGLSRAELEVPLIVATC